MEHNLLREHPDPLLTIAKAAQLMGLKRQTLWLRVQKGQFPSVAVGSGPVKLRWSDVKPFVPESVLQDLRSS